MKSVTHIISTLALGIALFAASPAAALVLNFNNPNGLDTGRGCESTDATCDILTQDFTVSSFGPATGTITWVGNIASINILISSTTFSGSYDGVEDVVFSNVTYTVSGWFAPDFGGTGIFSGFGSPLGTVSGTYEQFDASSVSVSGPTAFNQSVAFTALQCVYNIPSPVCGFYIGTSRDLNLDIGATTPVSFDFVHGFNLAAPEPGTAVLMGVGLFGMGLRRRQR